MDRRQRHKKERSRRQRPGRKRSEDHYLRRKQREGERLNSYANRVEGYNKVVKSGPDVVCDCCGQLFFEIGVNRFDTAVLRQKVDAAIIDKCKSLGSPEVCVLCVTCKGHILNGDVPAVALSNGLMFPEVPEELKGLSRLESILLAPILVFMNITELKSTKQYGISANVVSIPISMEKTIDSLPRTFDMVETIQLILKKRLCYKSSYVNEYIRPQMVYKAAEYLVRQPLLKAENIKLNEDWISIYRDPIVPFIVDPKDVSDEEKNEKETDANDWDETMDENPVNPEANHTLLKQPVIIAPGEGLTPVWLLSDEQLEEKAFPLIYCGQKYEPKVKLTYKQRVKSELRRFDRRAVDIPKIFFMLRKLEMINFHNSISIFCKMVKKSKLCNAEEALDPAFIEKLVSKDEAYRVLATDRTSPVYWSGKKRELMQMIRTLGIPTLFLTLSAAETRWNELIVILKRVLDEKEIDETYAQNMSWIDKCDLIRRDPVTCAQYFDRRTRELFKLIGTKGGPLGNHKINDFYIRIEFQQRGSPHIHSLLWLEGAPKYNVNDKMNAECEKFIDQLITCSSTKKEPDDPVILQFHKHTDSCRRNVEDRDICRFGIPHFPMRKTAILEPLKEKDLTDEEVATFKDYLEDIKECLSDHSEVIRRLRDKAVVPSFDQFLKDLRLTEETYTRVLRSTLIRPKVFLKREVKDIRTNAYNRDILDLHKANIDIQFVLNGYACVKYILDYINKSNRGMSRLMKEVINDDRMGYMSHRQKLYRIASWFINCSEVSAQEAVYILLGLQMSRCSRASVFINTGEKDERTHRLKSESELRELDPESDAVLMNSILEYYTARPDEMESVSLAEFASDYEYQKKKYRKRKFADPPDEMINPGDESVTDGKTIPLKYNMGYVTKRKKSKIIRFRRYDLAKDPLNYMREHIMLFISWRNEENDILQKDIQQVFKENHSQICEMKKKYFYDFDEDLDDIEKKLEEEAREFFNESLAPAEEFKFMQNDLSELNFEEEILDNSPNSSSKGLCSAPKMIEEENYLSMIRSLNRKQREFVIGLINHVKTTAEPFYYFLTGGAGTGKSITINAVYQSLIRWYARQPDTREADALTVLLLAPTGKSAFHIGGQTIHSALGITVSQNDQEMRKMSDQMRTKYRNTLRHLKAIICDECSMLGAKTLKKVHIKLCEIFGCDFQTAFGGISILFVGDMNQLRPVNDGYIFGRISNSAYDSLAGNFLWSSVRMFTLDQIMRQQDDLVFANALNNLSDGNLSEKDKELFDSRLFSRNSQLIPENIIHLCSSNEMVNRFNNAVINSPNGQQVICVKAFESCRNLSKSQQDQAIASVRHLPPTKTQGLHLEVFLKKGVRYMISVNIAVDDGLVNGAAGILREIDQTVLPSGDIFVQKIWLDFGDPRVGVNARKAYLPRFFGEEPLTPIGRTSREISAKNRNSLITVRRKQLPVVIAESITIHKSQGQTYEQVAVHMAGIRDLQLLYTGLSRAKTSEGLYLIGNEIKYPKPRLATNVVSKELNRLRNEAELVFQMPNVQKVLSFEGLKIFQQNINGLRSKLMDIESDPVLMSCDILCFVESRSRNVRIEGFELIEEIPIDEKYSGMSVHKRTTLNCAIKAIEKITRIVSGGHFEAIIFSACDTVVILVYCSPKVSKKMRISLIENLIFKHRSKELLIIDDINIDSRSSEGQKLIDAMRCLGFKLIVPTEVPSTDYGSQIDYSFASTTRCKSVYYESLISDHKSIITFMEK